MQSFPLTCNSLQSATDVGVEGVVAPDRIAFVEGRVDFLEARRSSEARNVFRGAELLADANMKRNLEENVLETSKGSGEEFEEAMKDGRNRGR